MPMDGFVAVSAYQYICRLRIQDPTGIQVDYGDEYDM